MKETINNKGVTRILITFALLLVSFPASAQWKVGLQAGYSHNTLDTEIGYAYDRRYESLGGFTIGIPAQYQFNDWFGLRADLSFIQKGYNTHRTGVYDKIYNDTQNSYLQLPVMASFSFGGKRLRGFLNLGGYIGYWLSSNVKGVGMSDIFGENIDPGILNDANTYYYNNKVSFDSRRDNRFEAGLTGGIGVSYQVTPRVELQAEGRCYYSLTDMQKQYMNFQVPRYNTTFTLQVGCLITLGKL